MSLEGVATRDRYRCPCRPRSAGRVSLMRQQTDQRFVPVEARAIKCRLMDVRASDAERDAAVNACARPQRKTADTGGVDRPHRSGCQRGERSDLVRARLRPAGNGCPAAVGEARAPGQTQRVLHRPTSRVGVRRPWLAAAFRHLRTATMALTPSPDPAGRSLGRHLASREKRSVVPPQRMKYAGHYEPDSREPLSPRPRSSRRATDEVQAEGP